MAENLAVHFIAFGDREYVGGEVTPDIAEQLAQSIRENRRVECAALSPDEYGEEDFLTVDVENGWAALAFHTWDESGEARMYLPVNTRQAESEEDAPVSIGGQSPVCRRYALDDLNLAAECVLHFAKTGELYPDLKWEDIEG